MTCAKGLTSGYVPMGAVVVSDRVKQPFWEDGSSEMFRHGYTYGGHPGAAAAGLANLEIIEREGLVERVRELEPVLAEAYQERFTGHPLVAEVRAMRPRRGGRVHARGAGGHAGPGRDRRQPRARPRPHRPRPARRRDAGLAAVRRDRGRDRRDGAAAAAGRRRRHCGSTPSPPEGWEGCVRLTPREVERLLLFQAAELARRRRGRGLLLNQAEATAVIADEVCEAARDGLGYDGA